MLKVTAAALTDVGLQRAHNEDSFLFDEEIGVYVVCDGMGGHASGEVASRLCAEHVIAFWRKHEKTDTLDLPYKVDDASSHEEALLSNAIQFANDRVYIEGMKDAKLEGMGTTIVAAKATPDRFIIAHVGDSRIYRWSQGGSLEQVTRDHSLLNYKIDRGELKTEEEIKSFKQGNIIVRAIGLKDVVEPEVGTVERRPGDVFLLCTDGLTDLVDDWSIENVLEVNYDELDEAGRCFIRMANNAGGKDNITVMLLRVDDEPPQVANLAPGEYTGDEITDEVEAIEEDTQPRGVAVMEEDTQPNMAAFDPEQEVAAESDWATPGGDPLEMPTDPAAATDEWRPAEDDDAEWAETADDYAAADPGGYDPRASRTDPDMAPFTRERAPAAPVNSSGFAADAGFVGESGGTLPAMPAFKDYGFEGHEADTRDVEAFPAQAAQAEAYVASLPDHASAAAAEELPSVIVDIQDAETREDHRPVPPLPPRKKPRGKKPRVREISKRSGSMSEHERRVPTAKIQQLQGPPPPALAKKKAAAKKKPQAPPVEDELPSIIIDDSLLK